MSSPTHVDPISPANTQTHLTHTHILCHAHRRTHTWEKVPSLARPLLIALCPVSGNKQRYPQENKHPTTAGHGTSHSRSMQTETRTAAVVGGVGAVGTRGACARDAGRRCRA
eukprot:m.1502395 g.1502395  ORF g.1502395 m.1502395 type:complete len:112 (-) comp25207_c0_seq41:2159-2494(-)